MSRFSYASCIIKGFKSKKNSEKGILCSYLVSPTNIPIPQLICVKRTGFLHPWQVIKCFRFVLACTAWNWLCLKWTPSFSLWTGTPYKLAHAFIMPNQLAKRFRREKIEANWFFVYLFIPSGFFCWQVSGIQPDPAYTNLSEGRGISHKAKLGRAEWQKNLRETRDHFNTSKTCHLQDFHHLLDSCHLLDFCHLQDSYHFSSLFLPPCLLRSLWHKWL